MIPNERTIRQYGEKVHKVLLYLLESTFGELQRLCQLGNVELCFALMYLLKEDRITQEYNKGHVYYKIR